MEYFLTFLLGLIIGFGIEAYQKEKIVWYYSKFIKDHDLIMEEERAWIDYQYKDYHDK